MTDWEKRRGGAYQIHGHGYRVAVNKRTDQRTGWVWVVCSTRQGRLVELANGTAPSLATGKRLGLAVMVAYRKHAA